MNLSYIIGGGLSRETVILAVLQSRFPGSEVDLSRGIISLRENGKTAAEIISGMESIHGIGRVTWHEGNAAE